MSEERLRELLRSTTPEPPVSVSLDAVRARVPAAKARRRWVLPTMAAAAVAVVATGVFAIAGTSGSDSGGNDLGAPPPPGRTGNAAPSSTSTRPTPSTGQTLPAANPTVLARQAAAERDLAAARARWARLGTTSYTWTYEQSCYCPPLTVHAVVGGHITQITTEPAKQKAPFTTMDSLFDWIGEQLQTADSVKAAYDEKTGAVRSVQVDKQKNAADDEIGYKVLDMTAADRSGYRDSGPPPPASAPAS